MINKRKIKKMKGFSLIELLAVIAVLAIIALISIPIVINIINNSKKEAFKNGVYSVYNAYEFAEASEDFETIEKADISDLDLSNERFSIGSIKRNNNKQIEVINLSDGAYCANGTLDDLTIIDGDCSSLDETAPIISNVTIEKTTSSVKVIVSFSEPDSTIKNYDFRLLDSEGNVVVDWSKGDNLSGNGLKRVATKTFDNLTQGKECKVIVRIQNNSGNQYDTITAEQIVILNSIATPEIVYDTTKYSYNKEVTLNYDSKVKSEYKVVDENSETVIGWTKLEGTSTKITIHNYNYTVLVRSSDGTTTLSNSSQIGYIDYTKPIVTISDISSDWGTSDEITLNMTDNLSGVISWCVTDASNSNLCDWKTITNTLNGTASYTLNTNGTYYAFIKDNVGNISDSYQFKITKVDTEVPEVPSITASDSIASGNWHKDDYILRFSGAESISGIEYYYGTNINDMVLSGDSVRILENTIMTTYYVKACNGAGLCSSTTSYVAKLDKIIPNNPIIATSDCIESDDWHTADYSLVFSNSASTSNVTYYYGTEQNNLSLIGTETNISSETSGTTYYVKACNEVNRCSEVVTYISKVDKTKPTGVYATVVSSTTKSLTVSASGNDLISGIAKYEFSKDNGATWVDNGSNNVYTFENLTTGTYTVKVRVTNNALLNTTSESITKETVAMVAPTAVVNTLEWASSKTVTITYPIGFNNYYKINNGEWIKVEENSINIPVTVSETEIFARTYDNVNYSGSESITVSKIDTKTPEVPTITSSDSIATNNWHTNTFTLNYSGSTSISGITYYYGTNTNNMTSTGASETLSTSTNGTTYYVKACNGAGTCSGNASYVVKLEVETPVAPTLTGGSTDYATTRTISISNQSSATSGIARYEYYISTSSSTQTGGEWTTGNSITDTTNGISYIYMRAISNAGKTGTVSAYQATYIDTNKPTISIKESGSSTITEEDSNPILTTYFNYSANGDAFISNTSCIDTSNSNVNVTNTNTLSVGTHVIKCTIEKSTGLSANASKTIVVNAKYVGVPNRSYTVGSTVTYGGVDFLVVADNGDSVTLITKTNVTTSAFGSTNAWGSSTAKTYLNTTWLNSKATILSDSQKTGLVYDADAAAYVRLIRTNELNSSIANASNTNFWTMTTNGSNVYYALANGSTTYVKYTASANTTGTCYSGSNIDLNTITSTHTKNTLSNTNAGTIAAPTATSGVISTSYETSDSGSCKATYTTGSESYDYDCNCRDYACECSDYTCYPYNYYYKTNTYSSIKSSYCTYETCNYSTCTGSTCAGSACAGSACAGSGCLGSGCIGSGCKKSGCTASGCTKSTCSKSTCTGSGCTASGCTKSTCTRSTCAGSACAASGCIGTYVSTINPGKSNQYLVTYCTKSGCTRSTCAGSGCAGSACAGSGCIGSGCKGSACAGSACAGSGCLGSGCVSSGCTASGCTRSGCTGSTCTGSTCTGYACAGSACAGWGCYGYSTVWTTWSNSTYTSSTYASTCTTCASTCTTCETCTGSRALYTASGSTVNWSRYVVSEQTATMGIRAVITVKKK